MSMKKSGLMMAAVAATLLLAGCATQGATDNGTTTVAQPAPAETVTNSCKGMSSCKGMKAKKHHYKKAGKKARTAANAANEAAVSADATAQKADVAADKANAAAQ